MERLLSGPLLVWLAALSMSPASALEIGDRVEANRTMNVRNAPAGSLTGSRATGDTGAIAAGPVTAVLSGVTYVWWRVDWDTGVDGWSFEDGISSLGPPPPLVYGIDVSRWQLDINWTAVRSSGKDFAFCKGTEGISYVDPYFSANMGHGRAAGVLMGIYHFARPNSNAAVDEARFFVKTATPWLLAGGLLPVLDLESGLELGREPLSRWARDWCREVERLTTLRPVIYTSRNYARNYMEPDLSAWPLWIAEPEAPPGTVTSGIGPWSKWTFKQYSWTGRVPGIGNGAVDVDLDSFAGTLEDLGAYRIPVITHTLTSAIPSAEVAVPGTGIILNAVVQSTVPRELLLGADFFPAGTTTGGINDSAHDGPVTLTPGSASISRQFTLPSGMSPGEYDLRLTLYNDLNGNGKIDAGDMAMGTAFKKSRALLVTPPGFRTWASAQGLSGEAAAPAADADGDGSDNLIEYAFGTLPGSAASVSATSLSLLQGLGTASMLKFTFARAANRPDLTWSVEVSSDLSQWTSLGTVTGDTPFTGLGWSTTNTDPALVTLHFHPYPAGPTFMRVKIGRN